MKERIFIAGAFGVIGVLLCRLLVARGHEVFGTTRQRGSVSPLARAGVKVVEADVYERSEVINLMDQVRPTVVYHLLTDLGRGSAGVITEELILRNARIRTEGTANLLAAASSCSVRRFIAQSIAWAYQAGSENTNEGWPLDLGAQGSRLITVRGVEALERQVMQCEEMEQVVLRNGHFYGPPAGSDFPTAFPAVHVEAAACAAALALTKGTRFYHIADGDGIVSSDRARRELAWQPGLRVAPSVRIGLGRACGPNH